MMFKLLITAVIAMTGVVGYMFVQPEKDIVIHYESWKDTPLGSKKVDESVRIERPNGDWRQDYTYFHLDGTVFRKTTQYAIGGKGLFTVTPRELLKIADRSPGAKERIPNDIQVRSNPAYVGEDNILGYKVFKIKNGEGYDYKAPALGMAYLKIDFGEGTVMTAVSVEKVDNADFGTLPDLPINDKDQKKRESIFKKP